VLWLIENRVLPGISTLSRLVAEVRRVELATVYRALVNAAPPHMQRLGAAPEPEELKAVHDPVRCCEASTIPSCCWRCTAKTGIFDTSEEPGVWAESQRVRTRRLTWTGEAFGRDGIGTTVGR
jgi:hypothetical protein